MDILLPLLQSPRPTLHRQIASATLIHQKLVECLHHLAARSRLQFLLLHPPLTHMVHLHQLVESREFLLALSATPSSPSRQIRPVTSIAGLVRAKRQPLLLKECAQRSTHALSRDAQQLSSVEKTIWLSTSKKSMASRWNGSQSRILSRLHTYYLGIFFKETLSSTSYRLTSALGC